MILFGYLFSIAVFILAWFLPADAIFITIIISIVLYTVTYMIQNYIEDQNAKEIQNRYLNFVPPPLPTIGMTEREVDEAFNGHWRYGYQSNEEITANEKVICRHYHNTTLIFTNGRLSKTTKYQ